ncbi:MAG TPA: hypothetical protein VF868_08205 [Bacteroidia bacterium]|jgi:hypothetical protein
MKTGGKSIIAFSALAIAFLAFKKQEPKAKLNAMVTQGKWKVNLYRDNGVDETNNYTGYVFQFKPNGTLLAKKDNNLLNGTWRSEKEKKKTKLYVEFASVSQLKELSEDWEIINQTADSLELADTTTGDGVIDYLNLQKIS